MKQRHDSFPKPNIPNSGRIGNGSGSARINLQRSAVPNLSEKKWSQIQSPKEANIPFSGISVNSMSFIEEISSGGDPLKTGTIHGETNALQEATI